VIDPWFRPSRRRLANALAVALCGVLAAARLSRAETPPTAQSLYQDAEARLATRKTEDLEASLELFLDAARLDPAHARAHAGAATAASLLALYSVKPPHPLFVTARSEAAAALRLEPELAPARAAMGLIEYLDGWDFAAAESMLRESLRLDPGYAPAWHWYGMMLMATSRFDASIEAFDHAVTLEPTSSLFHAKRAGVVAAAGRTADAERDLRRVVERFPQSSLAYRELGYLLIGEGRIEEGLASLRRAAELLGAVDESADLAWGLARAGRRGEAKAIARRLTHPRRGEYVSPLDVAVVYAGLERYSEALRWLDRAFEIRDPGLVYLVTAPAFATLRQDPRFASMARRMRLGPQSSSGDDAAASEPR
jgi:tetratricopeptide (TPR) repeat protein